jgi:DNA invertase Pin-like site-specific DNA recombinase
MSKIGYARVSTADQDYETQVPRLKSAGCEIVRAEKASGKSR